MSSVYPLCPNINGPLYVHMYVNLLKFPPNVGGSRLSGVFCFINVSPHVFPSWLISMGMCSAFDLVVTRWFVHLATRW